MQRRILLNGTENALYTPVIRNRALIHSSNVANGRNSDGQHPYRGGRNLSERFSHFPHLSHTHASFVDQSISQLSAPGLASESTAAAASRLARDGEEYTLFNGVRIPKKPPPPAPDGNPNIISSILIVYAHKTYL